MPRAQLPRVNFGARSRLVANVIRASESRKARSSREIIDFMARATAYFRRTNRDLRLEEPPPTEVVLEKMVPGPFGMVFADHEWTMTLNAVPRGRQFQQAAPQDNLLAHLLYALRLFLNRDVFTRDWSFTTDLVLNEFPRNLERALANILQPARMVVSINGENVDMGYLMAERLEKNNGQVVLLSNQEMGVEEGGWKRDDLNLLPVNNLFGLNLPEMPSAANTKFPQVAEAPVDLMTIDESEVFQHPDFVEVVLELSRLWAPFSIYWVLRNTNEADAICDYAGKNLAKRYAVVERFNNSFAPPWLISPSLRQLQLGPSYYSGLFAYFPRRS